MIPIRELLAISTVVAILTAVPMLGLGHGDDQVHAIRTHDAMETVWVEVHNPGGAARQFRVFAIGAISETPSPDIRLLPATDNVLPAESSKRFLAVFDNLHPGETRNARICYAPVNQPGERECQAYSVHRTQDQSASS